MINIVIPMAGLGSRFPREKYKVAKPFISFLGKPMIAHVLENLAVKDARYILIVRKEHQPEFEYVMENYLKEYNITPIFIDKLTEGTACTVLYSYDLIHTDAPLLIANSDQIVDMDINDFLADAQARSLDGSILTFVDKELNPKWSFAKIGEDGLVQEVKEKEAISEYATVGIYYFKAGRDFVRAAVRMIINNDRVKNEFYTCPVYNYLIRNGGKVGIYNIEPEQMHGIGTPEDLDAYIQLHKH